MPRIQVLPPQLVARIAAGEVIERPASVVKELVENAIDAGATEIRIEVEEGGKRLVRVRDDGGGIAPEDLPVAFQSHATSKLEGPEDLERIGTLGFRGEALAGIAAVAEVHLVSRTPEADVAHAIEVRGGEIGPVKPASAPPGTTVEVRNLFFNTPARRKFLRTDATEFSHIADWATRMALGFEGIRLALARGGAEVFSVDRGDDLLRRIERFCGGKVAGRLVPVALDAGWLRLRGFAGLPDLHVGSARMQHVFVNGRWVRERVALHALREAYKGKQIPGRHPVAFLFLGVDPGRVDVNVHPTKTEVRFRRSEAVHRAVHGAVRRAIAEADRGPEIGIRPAATGEGGTGSPRASAAAGGGTRPAFPGRKKRPAPEPDADAWVYRPGPGRASVPEGPREGTAETTLELPLEGGEGPPPRGIQIHRSFIVCETDEGLEIIDQHALHERILYEEIRRSHGAGGASQRLLIPETVELPHALMALLEAVGSALEPLGFQVAPFGEAVAAIHAVPQGMEPGRAAEYLREALEAFRARGGRDPEAWTEEAARLLACKRAVKAGQRLSDEEVRYLLERRRAAEDPRSCPHGRPTSVRMSLRELRRSFDRKA